MPIQTPYVPDSYAGDGVTNAFTVTFPFQLPTDLLVQRVLAATNAATTLVLGTDYSVTPVQSPSQNSPANTGTVVTPAALPVGTNIVISRAVPLTQLTTWVPNDPNPSTATMNAVDKLTMICQDLETEIQNIQLAPSTGIVTTVVFSIAAVAASQNITVNTTAGLAVGNNIQVSNVINTLYAQITAINALVLTATTLAITSGLVGNVMPVGSPVQLASVPLGSATIQVSDVAVGPTNAGLIHLLNGSTANASGKSPVRMYISSISGQTVNWAAYLQTGVKLSEVNSPAPIGFPTIPFFGTNATNFSITQNTGVGAVLQIRTPGSNPNAIDFGLINAAISVGSGTIIPSLLHTTNSPTDTYVLSYDLASTNFAWVPNTSAAVPGGGTAGQFLRGDIAWSSTLNTQLSKFVLTDSGGTYGGAFISDSLSPPSGFSNIFKIGTASGGPPWTVWDASGLIYLESPIVVDNGSAAYVKIDSTTAEFGQMPNGIFRAKGLRTTHGPWQFAYTINAPATSITIDLANGAYQRLTGIANAVTITLADSTPAPTASGWQFASQLTLEINSPGANVFTWPGTITWANGASAPTLSASGINVIRLIRRQGQTQWVGYVENPASTTYTNAQARTAVLDPTYLTNSGSIQWNIIAGTSAQPFIPANSIGGGLLAPGCINSTGLFGTSVIPAAAIANGILPTAKLALPGGSTVYMDGNGNFSTPAGGGGGGIQAQNLGTSITGGPFTTINFGANLTGQNLGGGVLGLTAAGASGGGQSQIQVQNNGTNYAAPGDFTVYNMAKSNTTTGPKNLAFTGSAPTANLTSAFGWYNVKFYGATGNGVTDDLAAINAAIAAASANGGGTVYFPAGNYAISGTINLVSAVSLWGDGSGRRTPGSPTANVASKITWAGGSSAGAMISAAGNIGGLTIYGIFLFGASLVAKGFYFESLSHSMVVACSVESTTSICMHIFPQSGQDGCTANKFDNLYLIGTASVTGIKIEAAVSTVNCCHCQFSNTFITAGNYAIDAGWSDNICWTQTYCFRVPAAIVSKDVRLRSQVAGLGVTAFAQGHNFYHLEGEITVDAAVSGTGTNGNLVWGYDRSNGQAAPVVGSGSIFTWFEADSGTAIGMFFANGTAVTGVEYNFSLGDACLLSPGLNSGNPVKFSRINFT